MKAVNIIDMDCPSEHGLFDSKVECTYEECTQCWREAVIKYKEEQEKMEFKEALDIVIAGATCHSMGSCGKCPYYNTPTCDNNVTCYKVLKAVEIVKEGLNGRDW